MMSACMHAPCPGAGVTDRMTDAVLPADYNERKARLSPYSRTQGTFKLSASKIYSLHLPSAWWKGSFVGFSSRDFRTPWVGGRKVEFTGRGRDIFSIAQWKQIWKFPKEMKLQKAVYKKIQTEICGVPVVSCDIVLGQCAGTDARRLIVRVREFGCMERKSATDAHFHVRRLTPVTSMERRGSRTGGKRMKAGGGVASISWYIVASPRFQCFCYAVKITNRIYSIKLS